MVRRATRHTPHATRGARRATRRTPHAACHKQPIARRVLHVRSGTDVDGADAAHPIAECSVRIVSLPTEGTLHEVNGDGTFGPALQADALVHNITIGYLSRTFADTAGQVSCHAPHLPCGGGAATRLTCHAE